MALILDQPQAQELLDQTTLDPQSLRVCKTRLTRFIHRYLPLLTRSEQRQHAQIILQGKLSDLQRKTTEPLASQAGHYRRPLQLFVGAGAWSDEALRDELAKHVTEQIGHSEAVLVLDPSAFAKKGTHSCGVARQWCGRLGKIENCQVGVFLAYVSPRGKTLLDAQLYLPQERAEDPLHRSKTHVPDDVDFQEKWRIGLELLAQRGSRLPHGWVTADDEFGRVTAFRSALRLAKERYVLDVPCDTLVRDFTSDRPLRKDGKGLVLPRWQRVDAWKNSQSADRWRSVTIKEGTKGPLEVEVCQEWVQTKDEEGGPGPRELLTVIRNRESSQVWYTLSNAEEVSAEVIAKVHGHRHGIEELFKEGNEEVGLNHYEVRSWLGWSHHMTLTLLALWFVQLERMRLKKNSRNDSFAGTLDLQ